MHSVKSPELELVELSLNLSPYRKINLHFGVLHSACHAISYIISLCFDNSGRYKCKLVGFAINLRFLRARTHQPECGMSELV